jgi:hypothetical protein
MNIEHNPPRRTAFIWLGIMLIGIIGIFLPSIIGMDGFNGGFALACLGGFIAMIGLIAAVIYFRLGTSLDRITNKENVLAYWRYSPEEWKQYTEIEHKEDATGRRNLFFLVAVISVIVGVIFWAMVRDNPLIIIMIILGIIAITGLTAWLTGLANYLNNKKRVGEVYIALDGAYLNRQLHVWKGIGNLLEEIVFEDQIRAQPRIRIEYSSPSNTGRNSYTARIPVPPGQEGLAREVVAKIAAVHLKITSNI